MLTARLPLALEAQLNDYVAACGVTKSFVVQEAVQDYLRRHKDLPTHARGDTLATPASPAARLQALRQELTQKYPGPDVDWREARDEGRK